jgi:hypothetical protein
MLRIRFKDDDGPDVFPPLDGRLEELKERDELQTHLLR